ncbi:STAS domain-containing protein [Evansella clarkii]|uniref:STAS domain-containing protein n=1 Tax=Evansella clarkii TaxID=79879 RepID=UPI000B42E459|nr:STAS domain-containing protein [Evansella clarkii]
MDKLKSCADYFKENSEYLAEEIVEGVISRMELKISEHEKSQALNMYINLLDFLGQSIKDEKDGVPVSLIEWSKENAVSIVSDENGISNIITRYPPTRDIFIEIITGISIECGLSLKELAFVIKRINGILDASLNETVFAFERLSAEYKSEAQREIARLSAPVVPVKEGIAILPLIGNIDSFRAGYIMESVIPEIESKGIDILIADFSGIFTIDSYVASNLHQIGQMLRLMGVRVITTGLRPDIVQSVTKSGINMSSSEIYSTVKQALSSLEQSTNTPD